MKQKTVSPAGSRTAPWLVLAAAAGLLDQAAKADTWLFMYETGDDRVPMKEAIEGAGDFKSASIVTGPEGGFEPSEVEEAAAAGLAVCTLGPRILRCETAPLCALTALLFACGELD